MRYKNVNEILPPELIEAIQEYIQGESIYIPKKEKRAHNAYTEYKIELHKRNSRIYNQHLEGVNNADLAKYFNLAESSIRRILIEQRKKYKIMAEKIKGLLINWGLQNQKIKQIYSTTWQIGENYVLKVYNDIDSLERNILLNKNLNSMGVPVGELLLTYFGKPYIEADGEYFFVSKKLKGSNIVNLRFCEKQGKIMGEIISKLHIAFKSFEYSVEIWDNSLLDELNGWVKDRFAENEWKTLSEIEYKTLVDNLEKNYDKLPVQLIHRDVHFGNFLFDKGVFSGYIDFDLTQKNIRIFDLCYFVLSVLSEKEKFEISEDKWFDFVKNVFSGYDNILKLTNEEKQSAVFVMESIEILFLAYFADQDDSALVESTYNIYKFIVTNEKRITRAIR